MSYQWNENNKLMNGKWGEHERKMKGIPVQADVEELGVWVLMPFDII